MTVWADTYESGGYVWAPEAGAPLLTAPILRVQLQPPKPPPPPPIPTGRRAPAADRYIDGKRVAAGSAEARQRELQNLKALRVGSYSDAKVMHEDVLPRALAASMEYADATAREIRRVILEDKWPAYRQAVLTHNVQRVPAAKRAPQAIRIAHALWEIELNAISRALSSVRHRKDLLAAIQAEPAVKNFLEDLGRRGRRNIQTIEEQKQNTFWKQLKTAATHALTAITILAGPALAVIPGVGALTAAAIIAGLNAANAAAKGGSMADVAKAGVLAGLSHGGSAVLRGLSISPQLGQAAASIGSQAKAASDAVAAITGSSRPLTAPDPLAALGRGSAPLSLLPGSVELAARALLEQPGLRSRSLADAAKSLGVTLDDMRQAAAAIVSAVGKIGPQGVPALALDRNLASALNLNESFDQILSRYGSRVAAPVFSARPITASRRQRARLRSLSKRTFDWLRSRVPASAALPASKLAAAQGGTTIARVGSLATALRPIEATGYDATGTRWIVEKGQSLRGIAKRITGSELRYVELLDPVNPGLKATSTIHPGQVLNLPASWVSSPTTPPVVPPVTPPVAVGATYVVQKGDSLRGIAKRHTGSELRYVELLDPVNPGLKATSTIHPGQVLNLPASWVSSPTTPPVTPEIIVPPIVPPITPPVSPPVVPPVTPAGPEVLQAQLILAAWCTQYAPGAYGTNPADLSGDPNNAAFKAALSRFQAWNNANKGTALPTDGVLDDATHAALVGWASGATPPVTPPTVPPIVPPVEPPVVPPIVPPVEPPVVPPPPVTPPVEPAPSSSSDGTTMLLLVGGAVALGALLMGSKK